MLKIVLLLFYFMTAHAFAIDSLSYSGRLVNTNGSPVSGPVDLKAELIYSGSTLNILCSENVTNVALSKGVFHIKLDFDCGSSTIAQVLSDIPVGQNAAIRITDVTHTKVYSFQSLYSMPFANIAETSRQLMQMGATNNQVLKWNDTLKKWEPGVVVTTGTVSNVTASVPLSVTNGTSTPVLSIAMADGSHDGYLSSSNWNTFNNKEGSLVGGVATQYYRGDKTWATLNTASVPESGPTNLYFSNARALGVPLAGFATSNSAIVATDTIIQAFNKAQGQIDNLASNEAKFLVKNGTDTITGVVNVNTIGALSIGYNPTNLTDATSKSYVDTQRDSRVAKTGDIISGILTLDSDLKIKGGSNYVTIKGNATSSAYNFILPINAGTAGNILKTDGLGNLSWIDPGSVATGANAVNSASIVDGSIVDADINASAAIAQSKIANLTTDLAGKISTTLPSTNIIVGNSGNVATAVAISGDATLANTGAITLKNTGTAGTYSSVTTDSQGRVTAGTNIAASASTNGYLTSTDWTTFNNKQNDLSTGATINGIVYPTTGAQTLQIPLAPVALTDAVNKQYVDSFGQWIKSGSDIYRSIGSVGIGTIAPATALDVAGAFSQRAMTAPAVSPATQGRIYFDSASNTFKISQNGGAYVDLVTTVTGVTSAQIADGTIVDADINASAAIAQSKIANLTTDLSNKQSTALTSAKFLVGNVSNVATGVSMSGDATLADTGAITLKNTGIVGTYTSVTTDAQGRVTGGTNPAVVASISGTAPVTIGGTASAPVVSMSAATNSANGYLSSGDWTIFNNKQSALSAGSTINGIIYPANGTQTLQIPLAPINLTDAVNKQYVDSFGQWLISGSDIYRSSGNVGIGTPTPGAKLEIAGQVKITGGTPGLGKILTSDANGLATWGTAGPNFQTVAVSTDKILTLTDAGKVFLVTGATSMTLPSAATASNGYVVTIKRVGADLVRVYSNGTDLLDGDTSSYALASTYSSSGFVSDGTKWHLVYAAGDIFKGVALALSGASYRWDDGTYAKTCYQYKNNSNFRSQSGTSYWIDPDGVGGNAAYAVTCDMINGGITSITSLNFFTSYDSIISVGEKVKLTGEGFTNVIIEKCTAGSNSRYSDNCLSASAATMEVAIGNRAHMSTPLSSARINLTTQLGAQANAMGGAVYASNTSFYKWLYFVSGLAAVTNNMSDGCSNAVQVFSTIGETTLTIPPFCTKMTVKIWAGGGGGANNPNGWTTGVGGGGGFAKVDVNVSAAPTVLIGVGDGGYGCNMAGGCTGQQAVGAGGGGGRGYLKLDGIEVLTAGAGGGAISAAASGASRGGAGGGLTGETMGASSGGTQSSGAGKFVGGDSSFAGSTGGYRPSAFGGGGRSSGGWGSSSWGAAGGGSGFYGGMGGNDGGWNTTSTYAGGGSSGYLSSDSRLSNFSTTGGSAQTAGNTADVNYGGGAGQGGPDTGPGSPGRVVILWSN